jgi:hypothetical protein
MKGSSEHNARLQLALVQQGALASIKITLSVLID